MLSLADLTEDGKQELALALLLWKDFKSPAGNLDYKVSMQAIQFAKMLGVDRQFSELMSKLPPMEIKPRS